MSETTQYRESDLTLVDLRLEGGQGGEIINSALVSHQEIMNTHAPGWRQKLRALIVPALLLGTIAFNTRPINAAADRSDDESSIKEGEIAPKNNGNPEAFDTYREHCHKINNFNGTLVDGSFTKASGFNMNDLGTAEKKGMFGVCFYYSGDSKEEAERKEKKGEDSHPEHWSFYPIGFAGKYKTGTHQVTPDMLNSCNIERSDGPCTTKYGLRRK